jgi:hypothetical protein
VKLEFEPGARRRLIPSDANTTIGFVGRWRPGPGGASANVPGGAVIHVLQWTESGNVAPKEIEGSQMTGTTRTSGRGSLIRLLAVTPGDWVASSG